MKTRSIAAPSIIASLLSLAASHATIIPYAEYHLGEGGSLGGSNKPQDSTGNGRHFANDIGGGDAATGNASFHPNATGSTAYLNTAPSLPNSNQGWYSGEMFSSLPTDNFAFGIFARAAANTANVNESPGVPAFNGTQGDIFTVGNQTGSFKLSLEGGGWTASSHFVNWIGSSGSFQPDTWVHLALIRSGGLTTFYVDGVAQGTPFAGTPVFASPHMSVAPGGGAYFDGNIDEARVVHFTPGEPTANIITALQQGVVPTNFVNVGQGTTFAGANLSTDQQSIFRLGGAIQDSAVVSTSGGLSVVAGTAPKHIINIAQEGPIATGTYSLIYYAGTIGGLGDTGFQLAPLPGRIAGSLVNNPSTSTIDLVITGSQAGDITWTGSGGNTWDVEGASSWAFKNTSTPTKFFAGDAVGFNNTGGSAINVAQLVTPSAVVIDATDNYSFSGSAIGGSSSFEKYGSGTLTVTNSNTYTGFTAIDALSGTVFVGDGGASGSLGTGAIFNDGTLVINRSDTLTMPNAISGAGSIQKLGAGTLNLSGSSSFAGNVTLNEGTIQSANPNCLGDNVGTTTVADGATLDVFSGGFGSEPLIVNGSGADGLGVIVNSTLADKTEAVKKLTLASDSSFGGTARWDVRGNDANLGGSFKFTKIGTNHIGLVTATVAVKNIEVTSGLLSIEYGANVNNSDPGAITVTGGTLGFADFGVPFTCTKPIVINGGVINSATGGTDGNAIIASTVELAGASNSIDAQGGATLTFTGAVSGAGSLVKGGDGTVALSAAPTYTGNTTVSSGTLSLALPGLAAGSTVNIAANATLNLGFDGTNTVQALFIGGIQQPAAVYGVGHASGRFAGSGTLTVSTGPVGTGYQLWENANGITGAGATADSDNDGIANGIEFVIGGDPSGPNSDSHGLLPTITKNATHLVLTYRRTDASASTAPFVQYDSPLNSWTTAQDGVNGVSVVIANNFYDGTTDKVTVSIPVTLAEGNKLFARLNVTIP